jgi:hypothetical protein
LLQIAAGSMFGFNWEQGFQNKVCEFEKGMLLLLQLVLLQLFWKTILLNLNISHFGQAFGSS